MLKKNNSLTQLLIGTWPYVLYSCDFTEISAIPVFSKEEVLRRSLGVKRFLEIYFTQKIYHD